MFGSVLASPLAPFVSLVDKNHPLTTTKPMYYYSLQRELMTTATQQIPSNPALDFAQSILDVTNNGLELIDLLKEIAEGDDEDATTNDRIAAASILNDRAFGKSPRRISPNPSAVPETDADVGAIRESPGPGPEPVLSLSKGRRVTQIDDALNQSLGPAPSAHAPTSQPVGAGFKPARPSDSPHPFDPFSIHFSIQQHILDITNNGQTLRDTLLEIARDKDHPRITPYHRRRAISILLDRALGTDPNAVWNTVCPDCRQSWTTHTCSPDHLESRPKKAPDYRNAKVDPEALAKARAEIQRMKDEGILTPYPKGSRPRITVPEIPEEWAVQNADVIKEEAAKFWADIELTLERQKQWPAIEERRRKKLAQLYPSHSDDDEPPDP